MSLSSIEVLSQRGGADAVPNDEPKKQEGGDEQLESELESSVDKQQELVQKGSLNGLLMQHRALSEAGNATKLPNPSQIAATLFGLADSLLLLPMRVEPMVISTAADTFLARSCVDQIIENTGLKLTTSETSFRVFESYLSAIGQEVEGGPITSQKILAGMKSHAVRKESENPELWAVVSGVIDKLSKVSRGLGSGEVFTDERPELVLQRAVCLASLVDNYQSFSFIRENWKVGDAVEALARVLVAARGKLNRIPEKLLYSSPKSYRSLLLVTSKGLKHGQLSVEVGWSALDDLFNRECSVRIGEQLIATRTMPGPNDLLHVVTVLRSCGYDPRPAMSDSIDINFFLPDAAGSVNVRVSLKKGPTKNRRDNVEVSARVLHPLGKSIYANKKTRSAVHSIAEGFMVSVVEAEDLSEVFIKRYQLIDTMDKDELNYHVELVALAAQQFSKEVSQIGLGQNRTS